MSELKAFTFCLGQYTENGSPCVVAVDDEENPRLASDEKFYLKSEADKYIEELKERSQWHRQKDKDIFFECGKHWGAEYIVKMKDGTTHLAYGGCDEGGDGSVSTYLHLQEDDEWDNDYEWEYDDIDIWYEIPDSRIDGNIKEA